MSTIVYRSGGDIYLGEMINKTLLYWKSLGKRFNQKYLYKGYRYYDNKKDSVIVFDDVLWSKDELFKRKKNGFLGIKKYSLLKGD